MLNPTFFFFLFKLTQDSFLELSSTIGKLQKCQRQRKNRGMYSSKALEAGSV